jgi:3-hydroxy-9,10-secoandrosta-1,3,5(10)-triene-9,17-dione monooxygenase
MDFSSGGYRLKGHWRYGSGFPHGQWILLSAFEIVNGEKGPLRRFMLPVKDCTPQNNWQVAGLAATGTWDTVLNDVFVPAHRSMPAAGMVDGTAPGIATNSGPLWRIPLISFYYPNMAAMMVGAAEGVQRLVREQIGKRVFSYGGAQAAELAYVRANLARHTVSIEAAGAMLDVQIARVHAAGLRDYSASPERARASGDGAGIFDSLEERFAIRPACTWAVKQARAALNELTDQAGTGSFMLSSPLQRFQREINVLSSHAFYEFDRQLTAYGQLMLEGTLPAMEMM